MVAIKFSNAQNYTLTANYVASDIINIDWDQSITIYPFYTAGAGSSANTLQFQVEINPYSLALDSAGTYFKTIGTYTNSSGSHTEQDYVWNVAQGVASALRAGTPLTLTPILASRLRIKAKETVGAGSAGAVFFIITKSNNL